MMTTVFVSYSHLDRKWCDPKAAYPLIPWLENALRRDGVTLWYDRSDDTGILPGAQFQDAILSAIDASQVALLLVSEAFFASDFIRDVELPRILQRAEGDGLVIIPILLEPCDWQSFEYVASRQMLPGEPTPLINYTGSDREWVYARDQVLSGIRRRLREHTPLKPAAPSIPAALPVPSAPPGRRWVPIVILALAALAIVAGAGWGLSRRRDGNPPESSAPAAPTTAARVTSAPVKSQAPTESPRAPSSESAQPTSAPAVPTASPATALPDQASTAPEASEPTAPPALPSPTSPRAIPLDPINAAGIAPLVYRSEEEVRELAWLPDGDLLLSLLSNGLKVRDPASGQERKIDDRGAEVLAVGKDVGGRTLVALAGSEAVQILDVESGGEVATIPALKQAQSLAFSPDATLLAAGLDEAVKLVEVPSGREVDTLLGVISSVQRVAFSPDGKTLAAGGQNVMLWNLADRAELANFKVQPWAKGLAFSPDNKLLAVGSYDGLELYDLTKITDSRPRMVRKISEDKEPALAWSPDGALLAWTSPPALVKLWDVAEARELATLKGHTSGIVGVGFSPDGKWLATGTRDGLRLWGASADGPLPSPAPPAAGPMPTAVPISPTAITAANAGQLVQTDLWEQEIYNSRTLAWAPDGAWLACCSSPVRIYDTATHQARSVDSNHAADVLAVAPMPEGMDGGSGGTLLAAGGYQGIQVWDAESGGELGTYPEVKDVRGLAFSPDGSLLAAGANLAVKVLDARDGREIDTLLGAAVAVQSVTFSPDGKTLAAGGQNVITWEWPGGREIANVKIDPWATRLVFTPDAKTLAAATYTGVKIYEAATLRLLRSIGEEEPAALALSPDGKLLAWAARGSPIRLVDLSNGEEVGTLTGHTDVVQALAFSPDGARLASGSADGTIRFWGVGQ